MSSRKLNGSLSDWVIKKEQDIPHHEEIKNEEADLNETQSTDKENSTSNKKPAKTKRKSRAHKNVKCPNCDEIFETATQYHNHSRKHLERRFKCDVCTCAFHYQYQLQEHTLVKHQNMKHICKICNKQYSNRITYNQHVLTHNNKGYTDCKMCGKTLLSGSLGEHMKIHTGIKHKCELCFQLFATPGTLKRHIARSHDEKKEFQCPECPFKYAVFHDLKYHIKTKHESSTKCDECGKVMACLVSLKQHKLGSHSKGQKFKCPLCVKEFDTLSRMRQHRTLHTSDRSFTCGVCSKAFRIKSTLAKHMVRHMEKSAAPSYDCDQCHLSYKHRVNLYHHKKNVHEKIVHTCELCNKKFSSQSAKIMHRAKHEGVRHSCDICKKKFVSKGGLRAHVSSFHQGKKHACVKCPKQFTLLQNLRNHVKAYHEGGGLTCFYCGLVQPDRLHMRIHLDIHEKVRYQCPICHKSYSQAGSLATHMRRHTRLMFACQVCGKQFYAKAELRNHMDVHYGGSFPCDQCGKVFPTRRQMVSHRGLLHTGKVFQCAKCFRTFRTNGNLLKHLRRPHCVRERPKAHKCDLCPEAFTQYVCLRRHRRSAHGLKTPRKLSMASRSQAEELSTVKQARRGRPSSKAGGRISRIKIEDDTVEDDEREDDTGADDINNYYYYDVLGNYDILGDTEEIDTMEHDTFVERQSLTDEEPEMRGAESDVQAVERGDVCAENAEVGAEIDEVRAENDRYRQSTLHSGNRIARDEGVGASGERNETQTANVSPGFAVTNRREFPVSDPVEFDIKCSMDSLQTSPVNRRKVSEKVFKSKQEAVVRKVLKVHRKMQKISKNQEKALKKTVSTECAIKFCSLFVCPVKGCGLRFRWGEHLRVHRTGYHNMRVVVERDSK